MDKELLLACLYPGDSMAMSNSIATAKAIFKRRELIRPHTALIPPTIYYSKVGLELSKMVFKGQKMSPP